MRIVRSSRPSALPSSTASAAAKRASAIENVALTTSATERDSVERSAMMPIATTIPTPAVAHRSGSTPEAVVPAISMKRRPTAISAAESPRDREDPAEARPAPPAQQRGSAEADRTGEGSRQRGLHRLALGLHDHERQQQRCARGGEPRRRFGRGIRLAHPDQRGGDHEGARSGDEGGELAGGDRGIEQSAKAHREGSRGEEHRRRRGEPPRAAIGATTHPIAASSVAAMTSHARTSCGSVATLGATARTTPVSHATRSEPGHGSPFGPDATSRGRPRRGASRRAGS